ncbi:DUF945 domain-containing protein [Gammaproteobacteria bacterium]
MQMIRYSRNFKHNASSATATPGAFLSLEDVRRAAPAIFAESAHESRSRRYGFVPTEKMIGGLMAEGFQPVSVTQANSRTEGKETAAKHLIRLRHASSKQVDGVFPEVVLLNSHDGSCAYKIMAGLFRMVCANGLIAGEMWGNLTVPHKSGAIHQVIEGSYEIVEKSPALLDSVEEMKATPLSVEERHIFSRAALALRYEDQENAPITAHQIDEERRLADSGRDLWSTLNRTQENLIRGGLRGETQDENGKRRRTTTREIRGIDQTVQINRGLWVLAEEMRRLKTAA